MRPLEYGGLWFYDTSFAAITKKKIIFGVAKQRALWRTKTLKTKNLSWQISL